MAKPLCAVLQQLFSNKPLAWDNTTLEKAVFLSSYFFSFTIAGWFGRSY